MSEIPGGEGGRDGRDLTLVGWEPVECDGPPGKDKHLVRLGLLWLVVAGNNGPGREGVVDGDGHLPVEGGLVAGPAGREAEICTGGGAAAAGAGGPASVRVG